MRRKLRIELGRKWLSAEDVAELDVDRSIELDSLSDDPVDIRAEDRVIARGEPAIMDGKFCVRVWDVAAGKPSPGSHRREADGTETDNRARE